MVFSRLQVMRPVICGCETGEPVCIGKLICRFITAVTVNEAVRLIGISATLTKTGAYRTGIVHAIKPCIRYIFVMVLYFSLLHIWQIPLQLTWIQLIENGHGDMKPDPYRDPYIIDQFCEG